jgi:hypothetical protein
MLPAGILAPAQAHHVGVALLAQHVGRTVLIPETVWAALFVPMI